MFKRAVQEVKNGAWVPPVTAFCVSACLIFFLGLPHPTDDSVEYFHLASNIWQGLGFTLDGVAPYTYRPPLFSVLLGLWFWLFGGPGLLSASLFQTVVFALSALGVYLLGSELLGGRRLALVGSLFFAIHPFVIPSSVFILQEPLLTSITCFAMLASVRLLKIPRKSTAATAGVLWGLCMLGKTVAWIGPVLLAVLLVRRAWKVSVVCLVLAVLTVTPWTIRNHVVTGQFIPINSQGTAALEWYVTYGAHASVGGSELPAALRNQSLSGPRYREALWSFIVAHPLLVAKQTAVNAFRFVQLNREWYGRVLGLSMDWRWWLIPFLVLQLPLYVGALLALRKATPGGAFLGLFYLLYWLQYALYWGEPRFATPVLPALIVLGLCGWRTRGLRSKHGEVCTGSCASTT